MVRELVGAGLAVTLVVAGGSAMAQKYEYAPPSPGSTVVQIRQNTGSFGNGTQTTTFRHERRTWEGKALHAIVEQETATLIQIKDGRWVATLTGNAPLWSVDPPSGWRHPLEVGKTELSKSVMYLHQSGNSIPWEITYTVEAYEDVTVKAGTFKAFRVRQSSNLGNEDVHWWSPELKIFVKQSLKRNMRHPQGLGTREMELVSHDIRR
jgi:hypothetical protein